VGIGVNASIPKSNLSVGLRYFHEFANRSTFQGYSLQLSGAIRF
jgi:hypothetical protein